MKVLHNSISECGNGGVLVWASSNQHDGSLVSGNSISQIRADGGGNGQNGNGVNVFKADGVIVADNHIDDCAFTAVRVNSTNDTLVRGNTCLRSGEVAIFSEFAFSGSVISDNIIDGAATGISITNLDSGGQLAVCSGNIVRNITPLSWSIPTPGRSASSPRRMPTIVGNVVQNVPGVAHPRRIWSLPAERRNHGQHGDRDRLRHRRQRRRPRLARC